MDKDTMITDFAERYRLNGVCADPWKGDESRRGKLVIGKYGFIDTYKSRPETLKVARPTLSAVFGFLPRLDFENTSVRLWNSVKKALLDAGCTLTQHGDTEGVFRFDPSDPKQAEAVIKRLGIPRKRRVTKGTSERLRTQGFKASAGSVTKTAVA
jgi:hypothetical protein